MPQCQLRVFCSFSFQKSYTGNIFGIGRKKNPVSYFPDTYTESKGEKEGSHEASTPPGGVARGRNENPASYFPETYTESKGEKEGSHEASSLGGGAGPPRAMPPRGEGPSGGSAHHTFAYLYPP